jgi:hypothetical protein
MGVNAYASWHEAIAAVVPAGRVFEPRPQLQSQYSDLFAKYKELAHRLYGHSSAPQAPNSKDRS